MDASANLCVKGANIEENMRAQETKIHEQQVPRTVYYTAHARRVPEGPRPYLACFTAVAPVASL